MAKQSKQRCSRECKQTLTFPLETGECKQRHRTRNNNDKRCDCLISEAKNIRAELTEHGLKTECICTCTFTCTCTCTFSINCAHCIFDLSFLHVVPVIFFRMHLASTPSWNISYVQEFMNFVNNLIFFQFPQTCADTLKLHQPSFIQCVTLQQKANLSSCFSISECQGFVSRAHTSCKSISFAIF